MPRLRFSLQALLAVACLFLATPLAFATSHDVRVLKGHGAGVYSVSFSPDGRLLASGSGDKTLRLWEVSSGRELRRLEGHGHVVWSVSFSPDGRLLASGSLDETLRLWDVSSGRELRRLEGRGRGVYSVSFSPDGRLLASGLQNKAVVLWEVSSGRRIRDLEGHRNSVTSVSFSPDGRLLASGSLDKTIRLWEVSTGRHLRRLEGHGDEVLTVSFSPDGRLLASGGGENSLPLLGDTSVRLWEVPSGRELERLGGHGKTVFSVSFSPDGRLLASGSGDRTIRIWGVSSRRELRRFEMYAALSVSFSPDGRLVASSGPSDGTIRLWPIAPPEPPPVVRPPSPAPRPEPPVVAKPAPPPEKVEDILRPPRTGLSNRNAIGVVIGNKEYQIKEVPPVEFAIKDAQLVRSYLTETLGYREGNIIFLENATKGAFERVFGTEGDHRGQLFNWVKGDSDVFIYYSGHGAPDPSTKKGFFVPVDADPNYVRLSGYPLDLLYKNLSKLPARSLTVVIDACFSGGSDKGLLLRDVSPVGITVENPVLLKPGVSLFTASSGSQVSSWYREKGHGLFTYYFLLGLRGEADKNKDRQVTFGELRAYLTEEVPYMARRLFGREQTPFLQGREEGVILPKPAGS